MKISEIDISEQLKKEVEYIVNTIEWEFKIPPNSIHELTRSRSTITPRQYAHYFVAKKYLREKYIINKKPYLSLSEIGFLIGDKDHATVLHSCKTIENLIEIDKFHNKIHAHLSKLLNNINSQA